MCVFVMCFIRILKYCENCYYTFQNSEDPKDVDFRERAQKQITEDGKQFNKKYLKRDV